MAKTLRDLALALLNATLILVALCLFLSLQLMSKVDGMAATVTQNLQVVTPLADEMRQTRAEIADLRAEVAGLREASGEARSAALATLQARVAAMEERVEGILTNAETVVQNPADLVDRAIQTTADAAVDGLAQLRGCAPAQVNAQAIMGVPAPAGA